MERVFQSCILALILCLFSQAGFTCTDFKLQATDGTVMVTRSMEYALDLKSNLRSSNRGRTYTMTSPSGQAGLNWKAKYGYVFLDALDQDMAVDGMNEKGLSFEALYLPGLAKYQTVPTGQEANALPYLHLGDWILSNFETAQQVKTAIKQIYVYQQAIPGMGDQVFPLHFSIHDANNNSIVIEYVNGALSVYDNYVGVMTNSPIFPWHVTNLQNYLYLSPADPKPVVVEGVTYAVLGEGFGMAGLPGDVSPPSRFVRMAVLSRVAHPVSDAMNLLNLSEHIINNVDIFLGLAREKVSGKATSELTQWVVFKDLSHKKFYYRTYNNLTPRAVDLQQIDFTDKAQRLKMPIASGSYIQDVTSHFLKSSGN